jgi:hypothetical protein
LAQNDEIAKTYRELICCLDVLKDGEKKETFAKVFYDLGRRNILPLWLNTFFATDYNPKKPLESLNALFKAYDSEKDIFEIVSSIEKSVLAFDPKTLEELKNLPSILKNLDVTLDSINHQNLYGVFSKGKLSSLALISVLETFTTRLDLAIKTFKTSQASHDAKVAGVRELLKRYLRLMETLVWAKNEQENDGNNALFSSSDLVASVSGAKLTVQSYSDIIQKVLDNPNIISLYPSPGFNVNNFVMGSGFNINLTNGNDIKSLEDAFTTLHQNCLAILSRLTFNILGRDQGLAVSPGLAQAMELVKEKLAWSTRLISIGLEGKTTRVFYNLPLQNHSVQMVFESQAQSDDIKISFSLLDRHDDILTFIHNETFFWDFIHELNLGNIEIKPHWGNPLELSIRSKVKGDKIPKLFDLLAYITHHGRLSYLPEHKDLMSFDIPQTWDENYLHRLVQLSQKIQYMSALWGIDYVDAINSKINRLCDPIFESMKKAKAEDIIDENRKMNPLYRKAITQIIRPRITEWMPSISLNKNIKKQESLIILPLIKEQIETYSQHNNKISQVIRTVYHNSSAYFPYDAYLNEINDLKINDQEKRELLDFILIKMSEDHALTFHDNYTFIEKDPKILFLKTLKEYEWISDKKDIVNRILKLCREHLAYTYKIFNDFYSKDMLKSSFPNDYMNKLSSSLRNTPWTSIFREASNYEESIQKDFEWSTCINWGPQAGAGNLNDTTKALKILEECKEYPPLLEDKQIQKALSSSITETYGRNLAGSWVAYDILENFSDRITDLDLTNSFQRLCCEFSSYTASAIFSNPNLLKRLGTSLLTGILENNILEDRTKNYYIYTKKDTYKYDNFREISRSFLKKQLSEDPSNLWKIPDNVDTDEGYNLWLKGIIETLK